MQNKKRINPNWQKFYPQGYLKEYYSEVAQDEKICINHLIHLFKKYGKGKSFLEFGCGPTVHRAICASSSVKSIVMGDYLKSNINAVKTWLKNKKNSHNWNNYTEYILKKEGENKISLKDIKDREEKTRKLVKKVISVNALKDKPLGSNHQKFDIVLAGFCLEVAGKDKAHFRGAVRNTLSLVEPGGLGIVMSLYNCSAYKIGDKFFKCYAVQKDDLKTVFKNSSFKNVKIEIKNAPEHKNQGYTAMIFASGRKQSPKR